MYRKVCILIPMVLIMFWVPQYAKAHCEIPCGIYDDQMRIKQIVEHIQTIEKSMKQIIELEKEGKVNYNQLVRWIVNKEHHADEIQEIASQYFMTQRIKPETENYLQKLSLLHKILIYAMKCKQTIDLANVVKLQSLVKEFNSAYFQGHK